MARIDLANVRHAYGPSPQSEADYALRHVNQAFDNGGAYALLGPSGCGKTSLLNIISGLVQPTEGRIRFDGQDVTDFPTARRNIAQVFQFPVVYDSMTVRENLAFPLRNRGMKSSEARRRANEVLEMIGLKSQANRRARGLTADEKQKISLGRGLVRSDVNAILFDEPLTVIDPEMKWRLRAQLKELHRRFGYTMIYVTHDQTEALTFADQVVVMYEGQIVQVGAPADLFERPRHTFVGYFIGSPGMNVIPTMVEGANVRVGAYVAPLPVTPKIRGEPKLEIGVRPEYVRIGSEGIPISIRRVEDVGRLKIVHATAEGHPITAVLREGAYIPADPHITIDPGKLNLYADSWRVDLEGPLSPSSLAGGPAR
jgi:glycerol transport system ATP-binding protein